MLSNKITIAVMAIFVITAFAVSAYFYPALPDKLVSHWNSQGEPNGYMDKLAGAFFLPVLLIVLALLFMAIPRIDPMKFNIEKFRGYFNGFILLIFAFLVAVHAQLLLWNAGTQISFALTMPIGIGILFYYIGIMLEHAERNWFVGIRTPWTLSSDTVWKKTHKTGSRLFKIAAIIAVLGIFSPFYAAYFIVIPVIALIIYTMAYSYYEFKNEKKKNRTRL
jgi:uncharacterized membrane protein